jgi:hypothetical protein
MDAMGMAAGYKPCEARNQQLKKGMVNRWPSVSRHDRRETHS